MKILWLLVLVSYHALAQTDANSKPGSGEYEGVAGNPYFLKDWSNGVIRFSSGKVTDKFKLKFNLAQNRLLLQFSGSTFAAESKVNEFVMFSRNAKDSFVFRKGFPDTERGNGETYYQVVEKGKLTLLKLAAKDIVEEKEILASKVSRHYQNVDQFYVLRDGTMHRIDKDPAQLQAVLTDRQEEIKSYISDQQLKMRSPDDYVKVVKKYNELQQ